MKLWAVVQDNQELIEALFGIYSTKEKAEEAICSASCNIRPELSVVQVTLDKDYI